MAGVKFSQLPIATEVAADDYLAVLDTSESILKRMPTAHASTSTVFGTGSESDYGHVKLSDAFASTVGAAADGVAASQYAVYQAYQAASKVPLSVVDGKICVTYTQSSS